MTVRTILLALALSSLVPCVASAQRRQPRPQRHPATAAEAVASNAGPVPPTRPIEATGFALRPIDRATVRILSLQGVAAQVTQGRASTLRLVARPDLALGTGVVISHDGVVMTARHVLEGSDLLAVVFPGQQVAVPAVVLSSDPAHDVAFLAVQTTEPVRDIVPLPTTPPQLTSGQRVTVSGYPLAAQERYPAAVSGEFARLNNDGLMQLSISVNHGNSGGPVLDEAGHLIGVVSMRGEPEQGIEGLSLVEPIQHAVELWQSEASRAPRPTFGDIDAQLAWVLYEYLRVDPMRDTANPALATRLLAAPRAQLPVEAAGLLGALMWNAALLELEANSTVNPSGLPADRRDVTLSLLRVADELLRRVMREAPFLRDHYEFAHWYGRIHGSVIAPPPTPQRDSSDDEGVPLPPGFFIDDSPAPSNGVAVAGEPALRPVVAADFHVQSAFQRFLQQHIQLRGRPAQGASALVTLRIRVDASGVVQSAWVHQATSDAAFDADLAHQVEALVGGHPQVDTLPRQDIPALAGRDVFVTLALRP